MVNGWSSEICLEKAQLLGRSGFNRNDMQSFDMQNTEDSKDHLSFFMVKDYSLRLTSPPKNHQIDFFHDGYSINRVDVQGGQRRNNGDQGSVPFSSAIIGCG